MFNWLGLGFVPNLNPLLFIPSTILFFYSIMPTSFLMKRRIVNYVSCLLLIVALLAAEKDLFPNYHNSTTALFHLSKYILSFGFIVYTVLKSRMLRQSHP